MSLTLEEILHDIYDLEPALKERDSEVRALVQALLEVKPLVTPDPAFRESVRAKVLTTNLTPAKTIPGLPWYMLYLTPIGVAALLLLVFLPEQEVLAPVLPIPADEAIEVSTFETQMADPSVSASIVPEDTPAGYNDDTLRGGDMMVKSAPALMGQEMPLTLQSINRFEPIRVLVTTMLGAAGFIVVREVEAGGLGLVVAVSPYLQAEFSQPIVLGARGEIFPNRVYSVGIYHDNLASPADRALYNPNTDTLALELRFQVEANGYFTVLP